MLVTISFLPADCRHNGASGSAAYHRFNDGDRYFFRQRRLREAATPAFAPTPDAKGPPPLGHVLTGG